MILATWNLNNRVGKVSFKPEAARAVGALRADVVVLTEYFPQAPHDAPFRDALRSADLAHQVLSPDPGVRANRVLVASRIPIEPDDFERPAFDKEFSANMVGVRVPGLGLSLLGVRVPAYSDAALLAKSWEWLEEYAAQRRNDAAVIIGDLNVKPASKKPRGKVFKRMLTNGWQRAEPTGGYSYYGHGGLRTEIDHLLVTERCAVQDARYLTTVGDLALADARSALSDHAVLIADVHVR